MIISQDTEKIRPEAFQIIRIMSNFVSQHKKQYQDQ